MAFRQPEAPGDPGLLAQGAGNIFYSYLISLIASFVEIVAVIAAGVSGIAAVMRGEGAHGAVQSALLGLVVGFEIAVILGLVAFVLLYRAFSALRLYNEARYSVGYRGVQVGLGGFLILVLGVALLIGSLKASPAMAGAAAALILLGLLAAFVGSIMVAIGLWRLGDEEGGGLVKVGVILWILGVILSVTRAGGVLILVGSILVMLGARDISRRARARASLLASQQAPGPGGGAVEGQP